MASIQNYIKIQVDLLQKVEKDHINFKKSPKERLTVGYCQGRLEALEAYWTDFKSTHEKLILNATEEDTKSSVYFTENVFESLEERYYIYKGDLKNVLQILNTKHTDQPQPQPNKSSSSCNELKLPQIQIPSFSGNYAEWQAFHDLFTVLIDTNTSLQNVQKLHYLKASLKGDAEVLLRQFSITEDNYDEAWSVLKRRYDNKRYVCRGTR
ncbi:uncharacterized protein [Choristoneura fumiferana]|uniref:uncharacterized protein n=1 Tax=Choristoneura fumiferana TaxID=7141 RepID=UPI003D1599A8